MPMRAGLKRNRQGRSVSKLTYAVAKQIVIDIVEHGNYVETACAMNGIASSTMRLWMKRGRENPASKYGAFERMLRQATARQEAKRVKTILDASTETWTAAAWWLERKIPERWGRHRSEGKVAAPVQAPNILVDNRQIVVTDAEEAAKLRDGLAILRKQAVIPASVAVENE